MLLPLSGDSTRLVAAEWTMTFGSFFWRMPFLLIVPVRSSVLPTVLLEQLLSNVLLLFVLLLRFSFVRELFRSGTVGLMTKQRSLPPVINVVHTVPAELAVVDVDPFPNNSYSLSAESTVLLLELPNELVLDKAEEVCRGVTGSSSLSVFRPESIWKEV